MIIETERLYMRQMNQDDFATLPLCNYQSALKWEKYDNNYYRCIAHRQDKSCTTSAWKIQIPLSVNRPFKNGAYTKQKYYAHCRGWRRTHTVSLEHNKRNNQNRYRKSAKSHYRRVLHSVWLEKGFWQKIPEANKILLLGYDRKLYKKALRWYKILCLCYRKPQGWFILQWKYADKR